MYVLRNCQKDYIYKRTSTKFLTVANYAICISLFGVIAIFLS